MSEFTAHPTKPGRMVRRCQSLSPILGRQCEKTQKHNQRDQQVVHQHGVTTWGNPPGLTPWQDQVLKQVLDQGLAPPKPTFVAFDETHLFSASEGQVHASAVPLPLDEWWRKLTEEEIAATVPKAVEYGSTDLIDIGVQLGKWMKRPLTDAEAAELGCWFYLIGKMARATSAIDRGEMPSDDTIKDTGVYIKMIQRIRDAGSWPGQEIE